MLTSTIVHPAATPPAPPQYPRLMVNRDTGALFIVTALVEGAYVGMCVAHIKEPLPAHTDTPVGVYTASINPAKLQDYTGGITLRNAT